MTTATDKKSRVRHPLTSFGRQLKGFVASPDQKQLIARVGKLMDEAELDKVRTSIDNFVRKAGKENGVISVRSEKLAKAIIDTVVELDPTLEAKGKALLGQMTFAPISNANRDSSNNWIVKLRQGESVAFDGPNGYAMYKLVKTGEATSETAEGDAE